MERRPGRPVVLKAVARAHCWFAELVTGCSASMVAIAKGEGMTHGETAGNVLFDFSHKIDSVVDRPKQFLIDFELAGKNQPPEAIRHLRHVPWVAAHSSETARPLLVLDGHFQEYLCQPRHPGERLWVAARLGSPPIT